ncbi:Conserved hypothetical protein [Prochlorococcus marinus str. MIT 9303]|uniref:Uncharacterized protein n=1 Tax=Prochlorococcus marinus (strain MIT 9303) TaxID=59922 RepID=A2CBV8_PROM3|nr:Conserved hypothetical protein [Prochlorococcus marinus str. MIT 9303]
MEDYRMGSSALSLDQNMNDEQGRKVDQVITLEHCIPISVIF